MGVVGLLWIAIMGRGAKKLKTIELEVTLQQGFPTGGTRTP